MRLPHGFAVLWLFAGHAMAQDQWLEVEPFRAATSRANYLLLGEHYAQTEPVRFEIAGGSSGSSFAPP